MGYNCNGNYRMFTCIIQEYSGVIMVISNSKIADDSEYESSNANSELKSPLQTPSSLV